MENVDRRICQLGTEPRRAGEERRQLVRRPRVVVVEKREPRGVGQCGASVAGGRDAARAGMADRLDPCNTRAGGFEPSSTTRTRTRTPCCARADLTAVSTLRERSRVGITTVTSAPLMFRRSPTGVLGDPLPGHAPSRRVSGVVATRGLRSWRRRERAPALAEVAHGKHAMEAAPPHARRSATASRIHAGSSCMRAAGRPRWRPRRSTCSSACRACAPATDRSKRRGRARPGARAGANPRPWTTWSRIPRPPNASRVSRRLEPGDTTEPSTAASFRWGGSGRSRISSPVSPCVANTREAQSAASEPSAASNASWRSTSVGSHTSSASRKPSAPPAPAAAPALRAAATPVFGWLRTRIRGPKLRARRSVPSVDPRRRRCTPRTDASARGRSRSQN